MILKSSIKLILLFEVAVESLDLHVVVLKSPWVRELMQRESGYVACEQRCSWKSILTILPAMYVALTGSSRTGSHPEQRSCHGRDFSSSSKKFRSIYCLEDRVQSCTVPHQAI
jgi:hypothetical protein